MTLPAPIPTWWAPLPVIPWSEYDPRLHDRCDDSGPVDRRAHRIKSARYAHAMRTMKEVPW